MPRGRRIPDWAAEMTPAITLDQAWKIYDSALVAAERSEKTRVAYKRYIGRFIEYLREEYETEPKAAQITPDNVRGWIVWLKAQPPVIVNKRAMTKGASSMHAHVVCIKTFASFLTEQGVFKNYPLGRLKNPKLDQVEVKPFTRDEMRLIVAAIGDGPFATRNRALIYFMVSTGTRSDETCRLELDRLDLKERTALVFGKGRKERTVQFDKATARYLLLWLAQRPDDPRGQGRVFLGRDAKPLNGSGLYRVVRSLGERAGVAHAHPHRIRHSMATAFLTAYPGQIFQLQALLGHSQLETTRRYARVVSAKNILTGPSITETLGLH